MSEAKPSSEPNQPSTPAPPSVADAIRKEREHEPGDHRTPGTMTLTLVLLLSFAIYYFANWKALADVWHVR